MSVDLETFRRLARSGNLVPVCRRIMSDQVTPVLAYRRLVAPDDRDAPSFLLESVEQGARVGRHSILGAQPVLEVLAHGAETTVIDRRDGSTRRMEEPNPLDVPRRLVAAWRPVPTASLRGMPLPRSFHGGWVGYAGYDTVRYLEPEKLPFSAAPSDDRGLPDLHFGLYRDVVVFDHVDKVCHLVCHVLLDEHDSVESAHAASLARLDALAERIETHAVALPCGGVELDLAGAPDTPDSTFTRERFEAAVERCRAYIAAGDVFQVVLSQRFERRTHADPFEVYRALRIVNPSPYQIYLQARGSILVAASPEILCRVEGDLVTTRPLAGTRPRATDDPGADAALERELLADEKERSEHVMLVDLGRNDLGRVCRTGSIAIERCMEVERYSHVMHISSTVTGRLRPGLDSWDALRSTLPVGTVSGAPKVRAMQIIDELEPTRRGPYAGGIGAVGFDGNMDIALALRTMVVPTALLEGPSKGPGPRRWTVHLQAGAGIVADSVAASEYRETVSKAAALGRAIDLAERAFAASPLPGGSSGDPRSMRGSAPDPMEQSSRSEV